MATGGVGLDRLLLKVPTFTGAGAEEFRSFSFVLESVLGVVDQEFITDLRRSA